MTATRIETEAVALAQTLLRTEPEVTADDVDSMTLLARMLTASIAGVDASDAHWVLVRQMLLAADA